MTILVSVIWDFFPRLGLGVKESTDNLASLKFSLVTEQPRDFDGILNEKKTCNFNFGTNAKKIIKSETGNFLFLKWDSALKTDLV